MDRQEISALNREAWNEAAPIHAESRFERLLEGVQTPGFNGIGARRTEAMLKHGIDGSAIAHLCCNNGRDLLSLRNLGAGRCVGFDLSDDFIEQGRRLAEAAKIDVELVRGDVYELSHEYDGQFDVAYITPGALRPLPDLDGFFGVVARLLKPGGWMYLHEMHPFVNMYSMEPSQRPRGPRAIRHSYFERGPWTSNKGLDYYRSKAYRAKTAVRFNHKLSDIVQACVGSGLTIETLEEHPEDASGGTFKRLKRRGIPLSMVLTARSPG